MTRACTVSARRLVPDRLHVSVSHQSAVVQMSLRTIRRYCIKVGNNGRRQMSTLRKILPPWREQHPSNGKRPNVPKIESAARGVLIEPELMKVDTALLTFMTFSGKALRIFMTEVGCCSGDFILWSRTLVCVVVLHVSADITFIRVACAPFAPLFAFI